MEKPVPMSSDLFHRSVPGNGDGEVRLGDPEGERVAIITDNEQDYSVGLSKAFRETFTALGGQVVVEQSYESDDKDFKAQLTDVKAKNPDAIFLSGYYQEVSLIAPQARELGITVPFLGGDGWDCPVLTQGEAKRRWKDPISATIIPSRTLGAGTEFHQQVQGEVQRGARRDVGSRL